MLCYELDQYLPYCLDLEPFHAALFVVVVGFCF